MVTVTVLWVMFYHSRGPEAGDGDLLRRHRDPDGRGHDEPDRGVDQHERHLFPRTHHRRHPVHAEAEERRGAGDR